MYIQIRYQLYRFIFKFNKSDKNVYLNMIHLLQIYIQMPHEYTDVSSNSVICLHLTFPKPICLCL